MSMTGWRSGGFSDECCNSCAHLLHGYVDLRCNISQKAALAAWSDEAAEARSQIRSTFQKRRDHLLHCCACGTALHQPEALSITMVDVSRYGSSVEVAEAIWSLG